MINAVKCCCINYIFVLFPYTLALFHNLITGITWLCHLVNSNLIFLKILDIQSKKVGCDSDVKHFRQFPQLLNKDCASLEYLKWISFSNFKLVDSICWQYSSWYRAIDEIRSDVSLVVHRLLFPQLSGLFITSITLLKHIWIWSIFSSRFWIVVISFKNFHYFSSFSFHYILVFDVGDISLESRLLEWEKPHMFPLPSKILPYISEILLLNSTMWSLFFIDHGLLLFFSFFYLLQPVNFSSICTSCDTPTLFSSIVSTKIVHTIKYNEQATCNSYESGAMWCKGYGQISKKFLFCMYLQN